MQRMDLWKDCYQQLLAYVPRGVRWYWPMPAYYTGYEYDTLYDWDQYFEGVVQLYAGFPCTYIENGVRIILSIQEEDGFISRIWTPGGRRSTEMFKPFLAQQIVLCYQRTPDLAWLTPDLYTRLKKYLNYWLVNLDRRGAGLSIWKNAGHTGMDNQHERAGGRSFPESFCEGVDLNAYLVVEARALSLIAGWLGHAEDRAFYAAAAEQRTRAVREILWDEQDGIFYDHHAVDNAPIRVKYVGTFATLWAQIATPEQARRLVREHLLNEKEFWRPYPIPGLAATEPGYVQGFLPTDSTSCCSWRAHTYLATNYYTFQGLRRYGFLQEAQALAQRTWEMFLIGGRFQEYFASESGIGTGLKPFWGWSALAMFMEAEFDLGVDPTTLGPNNDAVERIRAWARHAAG
jgi:putative isomerase